VTSPRDTAVLLGEIARLTGALHAVMQHPDFDYLATYGGSGVPPVAHGSGWEPNRETPGHGVGRKPSETAWYWRRERT
jgi:hypothetical protein